MSRRNRIEALLTLAAADVDAAAALVGVGNRYAAYHCQQAAEKLTKAVLLHASVEAGIEHRIEILVAKLPADHGWRARLGGLDHLSRYATAYRYPTVAGRLPSVPDKAAVETDLSRLRQLIAAARQELLS